MNLLKSDKEKYGFLHGGGEMGDIIRSFDWSSTTLGPIEQWPLSLRTTLGIMLHSAFPMFLFWGKDLTCFYNNAYRPSLGIEGKHPAIGKNAETVWPDIWHFIGPLINEVMTGEEAVMFEDQLLPIYRNGRMEDVYWTFSYSPAYGDRGEVNGVFVTCTETTQKVHTVNRLRESQTRFLNLIREANTGIVMLEGEDLIVRVVNEAYGALIDRTPGELIDKPLFSIIPETEPYFGQIIQNVRLTGTPFYLNEHPYFIFSDGKKKEGFLNIVYQSYKEDNGQINGVMALCQDVTEQVLARKKIENSEQQVRSLVESAPFPIGVYEGREMRIVLANQSILDVWGKGNDVIGKLYAEILPELDNQEIFDQLDKVFTTGVSYHARSSRVDIVVNSKLQAFYFNYSFTPLFDSTGNIYGVMNTAAEVTDLHLAKQKVEQSEQNLRNMILQAPVAMCIMLGPTHVINVVNGFMLDLWDRSLDDVINKPVFEALPDARQQGLERLLSEVYRSGETFKATDRPVAMLRRGRHEVMYQDFVCEPYRDSEGAIVGILAVTIDVTQQVVLRQKIEEKVAERTKELATANSHLQRSNDELAQFAYIASHDLQEPLRKVRSFAEMLQQSLGADQVNSKTKNYLDKINSSTSRMSVLIRDVLAYSQLSGEGNAFKPTSLQQIIDDIKTDLELLIEQKEATIITEDLPVINAIPPQMSQLFANLLSNALKFTGVEGDLPVIKVKAKPLPVEEVAALGIATRDTRYYLVQVTDNGIGFAKEYAEKIFNIFQRLHAKNEYSGTGIGLAICKKIAQNHGGDIFAESGTGQGATFNIILPQD